MSDRFIRYESPLLNDDGRRTGLFGLVNGLARHGLLSDTEHEFWRINNAWYDRTLIYPPPEAYDRGIYPQAASWFRTSATEFLGRVPGYLAILRAHGVDCVERRSDDPGAVVYEDEHQVVVVPRSPADGL
ncbi:MAG: hypothetical protein JWP64_4262 [Pseudonocardia sp.]|uniref:hypothetical protein n=1 Tax=Pseudonocardia sp. TaxID=60912 RepID=UPI00260C2CB1|nr:hypothetical protein [Pseudonocardia sp.]MCU1629313.1 hypothetical protein [Pseudonocardia sp.]